MKRFQPPPGWVAQAYKYRLTEEHPSPVVMSHVGGKRFAFNWALSLVSGQLAARDAYKVLALRQGASMKEADDYSRLMVPVPWRLPQLRKIWNREKGVLTARHEAERAQAEDHVRARAALEQLALRQGAAQEEAAKYAERLTPPPGWWAENSKEAYSSAFEALESAFGNFFSSRDGTRKGRPVGWPKYKHKSGRESSSFTTGAFKVLDRSRVQLPVIG